MNNNTTYISGFIITLFFVVIMMNYKNKKAWDNLYSKDYVDSLELAISVKDSAIRYFNTYIPFGSPLDSLTISSDTAAGVIIEARRKGGYGKCVIINHNNGYQTVYAHLSKILVKKGQHVTDTTPIGKVGNTGYSTGCHLHYEIIKEGEKINPEDFIYIKIDSL